LSDYDKASCSEARCSEGMTDKEDAMPETLHDTDKKDEAIQCDIGIRWFDLSRKTVASVATRDISK